MNDQSKKTFDLGAFDTFGAALTPSNQLAVVLAIPINNIIEDENQPRKDFKDDNWVNFVADIKKRGIKRPLDVRPAINGIHIIINGERRYRGAKEAGLDTVPVIVREDVDQFDDYSQILDNIKNKAMNPVDIALFIKRRMDAGDSKSEIADKLSERPSYITFHLALTEMPAAVQNAYAEGKINGVQTVYQLNKLYADDPDLVKKILKDNNEITNSLILNARKSLKAESHIEDKNTHHNFDDQQVNIESTVNEAGDKSIPGDLDISTETAGVIETDQSEQDKSGVVNEEQVSVTEIPFHNPENEEKAIKRIADPDRIKKPLLLGYHSGDQACVVLIHERPLSVGFIWIKDEATGEKLHILAEEIRLNLLTDSKDGD